MYLIVHSKWANIPLPNCSFYSWCSSLLMSVSLTKLWAVLEGIFGTSDSSPKPNLPSSSDKIGFYTSGWGLTAHIPVNEKVETLSSLTEQREKSQTATFLSVFGSGSVTELQYTMVGPAKASCVAVQSFQTVNLLSWQVLGTIRINWCLVGQFWQHKGDVILVYTTSQAPLMALFLTAQALCTIMQTMMIEAWSCTIHHFSRNLSSALCHEDWKGRLSISERWCSTLYWL